MREDRYDTEPAWLAILWQGKHLLLVHRALVTRDIGHPSIPHKYTLHTALSGVVYKSVRGT
jgi:hypothetical protein